MRFEDVGESLGHFESMLFYGNNFGLFGSRAKGRRLLRVCGLSRIGLWRAALIRMGPVILFTLRTTSATDDEIGWPDNSAFASAIAI